MTEKPPDEDEGVVGDRDPRGEDDEKEPAKRTEGEPLRRLSRQNGQVKR